ncbi:MAG: DUF2065 domain-containing protein [Gammaproteobacteria bacterium]|nr:DUF2065 domain-containing protein [Gammaproteobacteria bacterium]
MIDTTNLILLLIALILILESILPLLSPKKTKSILLYFLELDDNTIRMIGGIMLVLGLIIYMLVI